ncbi:hypothetical protein [Leuconostoc sp. LN180020]|uniref:hypothetical protein n=1 Tax=Leuconostoc sp. LN180020 TaxID=2571156 RepID=UPI001785BE92|nr:hypothetical protein [Leuconostoc sp. LN180020]QOG09373.1 hypothetical protein FAZ25_00150 [Leuconostoc sp. LN180020]
MVINDLERNNLEIVIAKMNEASAIFSKLAANSVDDDFVAEMDAASGELTDFTDKLRSVTSQAHMIDYAEYHERYLRD